MCSIPPPPPPLPLASAEPETSPQKEYNTKPLISLENSDECKWALQTELQEACIKNKLCLEKPPFSYKYNLFESILQEGPTCGLVALSMLLRGRKSPAEILSIAKQIGFTNNGEMFSCKNMENLAKNILDELGVEDCRIELRNGLLFEENIVERLLGGSLLLVPYDADFNHSPCLKGGHKSHWSLVCGVAVINDPVECKTADPNNIYVFSKHGKSKYLAAWKLKDLEDSNRNLNDFVARKGETITMYVMPEGGVGGSDGLKGQYIIVDGL